MSKTFKSFFATFALTVSVLCLVSAANVFAQTQTCGDLTSVTGQPGWMIVSGPGIGAPKVPVNVSPYPGWQNALPSSSWISIDANQGSIAGTTGDYAYESTFCLCRDGKHALSLSFYADNGATVLLNGNQIFTTSGSYNFNGAAKVVNYSWAGGPGINKIQIVVHNDSGPTGLDAVLRISGATTGTCCADLKTATGQAGWMLVSSPGVNVPKIPVPVSPYSGWQNAPLPGSTWISIDASRGNLGGDYTYDFPFCVCKEGKHVLNLSFYADNGATVLLNSTQIFATTGVYNFNGAAKVVNYSWASGSGTNILHIVVHNQSSVTGLDAILNISGATAGRCARAIGPALEQDQKSLEIGPDRTNPTRPN